MAWSQWAPTGHVRISGPRGGERLLACLQLPASEVPEPLVFNDLSLELGTALAAIDLLATHPTGVAVHADGRIALPALAVLAFGRQGARSMAQDVTVLLRAPETRIETSVSHSLSMMEIEFADMRELEKLLSVKIGYTFGQLRPLGCDTLTAPEAQRLNLIDYITTN